MFKYVKNLNYPINIKKKDLKISTLSKNVKYCIIYIINWRKIWRITEEGKQENQMQ